MNNMQHESISSNSPATRTIDVEELKKLFRELDNDHEKLKAKHKGWTGVEPAPLAAVRNDKERIAHAIWKAQYAPH